MENKTEQIENTAVTCNRFVAFFDIMGFKDRVARNSHEDIYSDMLNISITKDTLKKAIEKSNIDKNVISIMKFSDSIMIFSKDDSIITYDIFTAATTILFTDAIKNNIPLKGAISYGKITVDKKNEIYFGQPIIDAYLLQEEVFYYGVVFHNTFDKYINDNRNKTSIFHNLYYFETKTVLKSGDITHKNLNWFLRLENIKKRNSVKEQIIKFNLMTSGNPRKYIDNTLEMYARMKKIEESKTLSEE
jgi:hypothetical protein